MAIKILLADDSLTIQKVVELTFSDAETRLMAVGSGDRAVQALDDFLPDIVLADVVMPGLTGYDVCDVVKQRPGGGFVPVVLLTGTFEPFDRARAERVGSDAIVTKPFDSHALQGLVRDLVTRARAAREEAEAAKAAEAAAAAEAALVAEALAPPPVPAPAPVPEPPATMILSVAELEEEFPPRVAPDEDSGATQALPAFVLSDAFPPPAEPLFVVEEPAPQVEDANYRTMAMRIPSAEELAAEAPIEFVEAPRAFIPPPPPPPPAFYEPEPASFVPPPPPPSPFYRPEAATPVPPPPPAFFEPEPVFVPPPPPPPPAFFEPEPALFVPPIPPPPPAFYEPEVEPYAEPPAPFEPEVAQAPEPFLVEMESPAPFTSESAPEPLLEIVPEPEPVPVPEVPEEVEVALYDIVTETVAVPSPEAPAVEEPAFYLPVEEPVASAEEPNLAAEAAFVEESPVEPFPEMDEPAPVAEAEAAPWDEGPAVEIPPPPPELSGGREDTEGTEPITRDLEADLEAFEASGRVRRRPEIWERHAALLGEEAPADIDTHGSGREVPPDPAMEDPSSSELEAMAAAARIEDLSALIPSTPAPVAVPVSLQSLAAEEPVAAPATAPPADAGPWALSESDVDRIARRVVQLLSDKVVKDIAWEVVPEYAERLVRERIAEVERAS